MEVGWGQCRSCIRECGESSLAAFGHYARWRPIDTDGLFLSQFVVPARASAVRVHNEIRGTWRR